MINNCQVINLGILTPKCFNYKGPTKATPGGHPWKMKVSSDFIDAAILLVPAFESLMWKKCENDWENQCISLIFPLKKLHE